MQHVNQAGPNPSGRALRHRIGNQGIKQLVSNIGQKTTSDDASVHAIGGARSLKIIASWLRLSSKDHGRVPKGIARP
jgi:hypothetical protein